MHLTFSHFRELEDILPGIINQLGPDNLDNLKKLVKQLQEQAAGTNAKDDEVPDLVPGETFEATAEEKSES
ncbi:hypothetical protein V2J09_008434 [Rumex salicifolius]